MIAESKKKIVLLGAADRYNYGDNLMPVLFRRFILSSHPEVTEEFEIVCAAVRQSDYSAYGCLPTCAISDLQSIPSGSLVVAFGGEVLCASSDALFMHMHGSRATYTLAKLLRRVVPPALSFWSRRSYPVPWEFPYIPSPKFFKNKVRTAFNAVGGEMPAQLDPEISSDLLGRFEDASFFSSRDGRFNRSISAHGFQYPVRPDSASSMSAIVPIEERLGALRGVGAGLENVKYVVLQAAPRKLGIPIDSLVEKLRGLAVAAGVRIVLLPIGHASGHDDAIALNAIARKLGKHGTLLGTLSLIQIMAVISYSAAYVGTSLHGAITALSFGKPHFCLGWNVPKLTEYLTQWSVSPFDKPVDDSNIVDVIREALEDPSQSQDLSKIAKNQASQAIQGYEDIVSLTNCARTVDLRCVKA